MDFLKKFFQVEARGSNITAEIIGGIVTFLAMVYILPVNSGMLSQTGMNASGVFVATALAAGLATILMGIFGQVPIALASGMGVNALFTYTVVFGLGFSWQEALAAVLVSGVLFFIISITGLRKSIIKAIPKGLKLAIGVGIGFFIAFIGLMDAGVIEIYTGEFASGLPELGDLTNPTVLLSLFGITLGFILFAVGGKFSKFAVIISIVITGIFGGLLGLIFPDLSASMPVFVQENPGSISDISEVFGAAFGSIGSLLSNPLSYPVIFAFLFVDFFDTSGTLVAVGHQAGLIDKEGQLIGNDKALLVDAIGTVFGAVAGTSTVTSYIESTTGIQSGARTGLASVVTGILFILSIFLFPLFGFVGAINGIFPVTSVALVLVGALMMKSITDIDFDDPIILISGFVTIIMMILTYNISYGIAFGFMIYALLMALSKRRKSVHPLTYILGIVFLLYFVIYYIWIV